MAFTRNPAYIPALTAIYEKHIEYFKVEWAPIHGENFYACDDANKQFQILTGFETALHSLYFGSLGLSPEKKFDYHKKQSYLSYRFMMEISRRNQIIDEFQSFSPYVKDLRKKYWLALEKDSLL